MRMYGGSTISTLVVENEPLCPLGGLAEPLRRAGVVDMWRPERDGAAPSLEGYDDGGR